MEGEPIAIRLIYAKLPRNWGSELALLDKTLFHPATIG